MNNDATKPHMVLNWIFDIPNNKLTCKIGNNKHFVEYEAIQGGTEGFDKYYKGKKTHLTIDEWRNTEKFWISDNWGDLVGYFQPNPEYKSIHPKHGYEQQCAEGFGNDGEYLDHMQRSQYVLEGHDMAMVWYDQGRHSTPRDLFSTPDCGKTIYKRVATQDVLYPRTDDNKDAYWPEWPQACMMHPRTKGYRLSNYDELEKAGAPESIIKACMAGEWDAPPNPELQKYYIYPTE